MTNWAQYRPNDTKYVPSNLDPFLCTHYIYAFAAINTTNYEIKSFEWNDESKDDFVGKPINLSLTITKTCKQQKKHPKVGMKSLII